MIKNNKYSLKNTNTLKNQYIKLKLTLLFIFSISISLIPLPTLFKSIKYILLSLIKY